MAWLLQEHIKGEVMMKSSRGEGSGKLHVTNVICRGTVEKKAARSQRKRWLEDLKEGNNLR